MSHDGDGGGDGDFPDTYLGYLNLGVRLIVMIRAGHVLWVGPGPPSPSTDCLASEIQITLHSPVEFYSILCPRDSKVEAVRIAACLDIQCRLPC